MRALLEPVRASGADGARTADDALVHIKTQLGRADLALRIVAQAQSSGQPLKNTVVRIPGPSCTEKRCISNIIPVRKRFVSLPPGTLPAHPAHTGMARTPGRQIRIRLILPRPRACQRRATGERAHARGKQKSMENACTQAQTQAAKSRKRRSHLGGRGTCEWHGRPAGSQSNGRRWQGGSGELRRGLWQK